MRQPAILAFSACFGLTTWTALADNPHDHQVKQTPPVKMGTSGGSANDSSRFACCGGTLGSLVLYDGAVHILSNNHILARSGSATTGEDTVQPGLVDTNCSTAGDNIVGDFIGNKVPLGSANVDAALSLARAGMVDATGAIINIGVPCSNIQNAAINMQVIKSGRTTGVTTGSVTSINTSVSVQYQQGCASGRRFTVSYTNQVVTTNMSSGGDSGSLLLSNDGTLNPVALLFAGSSSATIYNPAQAVANAFTSGGHTFSWVGTNCGGLNVADPVNPNNPTAPSAEQFEGALQIKVENEHDLMKRPGVWGVGVGADEFNPAMPVIVVYLEAPDGKIPADFPNEINGIKVRVIFTDPIVAQ